MANKKKIFVKYDSCTAYRSDTIIGRRCCSDEKQIMHPYWFLKEVAW